MVEKTVTVAGKQVTFRASAALPRLYRMKFGRELFADMDVLNAAFNTQKDPENGSSLLTKDLVIFENIAYIMAYHADQKVPDNVEDWLEQFDMFSIYEILPVLLSLWGINLETTSEPVKKQEPAQEK